MKELVILLVHCLTAVARLLGPGGAKTLVAENLLIKHQLIILTRDRQRAPNLRPLEFRGQFTYFSSLGLEPGLFFFK